MRNGCIDQATGNLLKVGYIDQEASLNDSDFNPAIHEFKSDAPDTGDIWTASATSWLRWDGVAWLTTSISLSDLKARRITEIEARTKDLVVEGTFIYPDPSGKTYHLAHAIEYIGLKQAESTGKLTSANVSTEDGEKVNLANVTAIDDFYTLALTAEKTILDGGIDLKDDIFQAVDEAAVNAIVDNR